MPLLKFTILRESVSFDPMFAFVDEDFLFRMFSFLVFLLNCAFTLQVSSRSKFGLLEKRKDYQKRAR